RDLLAVVATAGRPLRQEEACGAAGLAADVLPTLALLRSERLVRGRGLDSEGVLAAYHDRGRETVGRNPSPAAVRAVHRRLVETLEVAAAVDPEEFALHLEGAGETGRASQYYALAADRAAEALAFDYASKLYRRSLQLRPMEEGEWRTLRT